MRQSAPNANEVPLWQPGPALDFPGFELAGGSLVSPPPPWVRCEELAFVLQHSKPRGLRFASIGQQVTVRRGAAVLVEGIDYTVDRARGVLAAGASVNGRVKVRVEYEAAPERIDVVVADGAGKLSLLRGAEVPRLAQQFEPTVGAPYRKLFRIYRTAAGCAIQPVHAFRREAAREVDAYAAAIQRSRDCLSHFKRTRLAPGAHLRWGFLGDSTTALGVGSEPALNHCANIDRDLDHFFRNYDEAALAGLPRYVFGELYPQDVPQLAASGYLDAQGADGYGRRHVKASMHWRLVEWIEARFGVTVAVRNWGIGGTRSGRGTAKNGLMNMGHPERLRAVLADGLDIVSIAAGTNELGDPALYANVMHLATAIRSSGAEVLLCSPLRVHPLLGGLDDWRRSCDDIERAARDLGCACVQTRLRFDDDALASWLAPDELAAANGTHHPGLLEFAVAGELAIDLFR
jgi:hypothetical protein